MVHNSKASEESGGSSSNKADESSESPSSSKANDFSSDEAKESEGDSDPVDKSLNGTMTSSEADGENSPTTASSSPRIETKPVKQSCDTCNITVNSATQLAQVQKMPYFKKSN